MLRLARPSDADAMLEIYSPIVRDTWISFELSPPSVEEFRERIHATLRHAPWLVHEKDGKVIGYAYAKHFWPRAAYQWTVEVTVYVHPQQQGRGVGRALYSSLFQLLRSQGYCKALAIIALPNPASIALHEALGFTSVGVFHSVGYKLGGWRDVGWWELPLRDLPEIPAPPKPLAQLSAEEWQRAFSNQKTAHVSIP